MEKNIGVKYFEKEDARFATPKEIAEFRAKKLKCGRIVDLCCGIGAQTAEFSKTCKEVLGIELNKRKAELARQNCEAPNTKIIRGDVLSFDIIKQVKEFNPDIIFCDTERPESEKERNIENIKPNLKKLINSYSKICPNICIEIPPQIVFEKLSPLGNFEAEYLSYKNKLNRLELNFGDLIESEKSAIDVSGVKLKKEEAKISKTKKAGNYLYEVSGAVIKSELEPELARKLNAKILSKENTRVLLTSEKLAENEYVSAFTNVYSILGVSSSEKEIKGILEKNNIGKVVLKKKVTPEEYWNERKKYEAGLKGEKEVSLFSYGPEEEQELIVAELVN